MKIGKSEDDSAFALLTASVRALGEETRAVIAEMRAEVAGMREELRVVQRRADKLDPAGVPPSDAEIASMDERQPLAALAYAETPAGMAAAMLDAGLSADRLPGALQSMSAAQLQNRVFFTDNPSDPGSTVTAAELAARSRAERGIG